MGSGVPSHRNKTLVIAVGKKVEVELRAVGEERSVPQLCSSPLVVWAPQGAAAGKLHCWALCPPGGRLFLAHTCAQGSSSSMVFWMLLHQDHGWRVGGVRLWLLSRTCVRASVCSPFCPRLSGWTGNVG